MPGQVAPHHAGVDGKIVPHYAIRLAGSATFADRAVSADSRPGPEEVPMSDPVGMLVDQLNGILATDGLGPLEFEGVAVLAVLEDDQAAKVEAALSRAAANGHDVPTLHRLC